MTFLIAEEVNILRGGGGILEGEVSKFLAVRWDSSLSPGSLINVYGDNGV